MYAARLPLRPLPLHIQRTSVHLIGPMPFVRSLLEEGKGGVCPTYVSAVRGNALVPNLAK